MERKNYALVTGGSRGIGRAICIALARDLNYPVLINYQSNAEAAEETKAIITANGGQAELIRFDVSNPAETREQLTEWKDRHPHGLIEVIVNNAGITRDGLFMWMEPDDWNQVVQTSLNGFYHVTKFLIQDLLRHRYGRIINVTSVSGAKGTAGQTNYSAAKAGLIGATKALAQEVAKRNITVNAVAPGFVETDMTSELDEKELKKLIPLNRFGKAEEVADLVCFLASRKASYITGEVIHINGGIYS
ncbi:3-oxoacyl-ACP reductase FabG [Parapedobacter indicus]|uniref:3-oxoacyl-[acyl-carrier protein] reductase n=1 Tax=Parapedobacter indicus TaxID=1477437 RepID=A0A1I3FGX2_9SPHI|nr:3-oxoacyl-ACP reductase FabG [Parapedobacter indicus]PPL03722.1 3-oxoacyl-[acyl-carrier protein] reductase [Parapedobacter indicus]SFI10498.1 3-oxoacyl-[acyl-carrier protein] reductase [Parapedobacter indicus]